MHDYVVCHCSIDYCVELSHIDKTSCKNLLSFHKNDFNLIPLGNCTRGELQIDAINSNFFESAFLNHKQIERKQDIRENDAPS